MFHKYHTQNVCFENYVLTKAHLVQFGDRETFLHQVDSQLFLSAVDGQVNRVRLLKLMRARTHTHTHTHTHIYIPPKQITKLVTSFLVDFIFSLESDFHLWWLIIQWDWVPSWKYHQVSQLAHQQLPAASLILFLSNKSMHFPCLRSTRQYEQMVPATIQHLLLMKLRFLKIYIEKAYKNNKIKGSF